MDHVFHIDISNDTILEFTYLKMALIALLSFHVIKIAFIIGPSRALAFLWRLHSYYLSISFIGAEELEDVVTYGVCKMLKRQVVWINSKWILQLSSCLFQTTNKICNDDVNGNTAPGKDGHETEGKDSHPADDRQPDDASVSDRHGAS